MSTSTVSYAAEPDSPHPLQFSIDAVTMADNCLYALQTTRDPDAGDCVALMEFHQREYADWTPLVDALDANSRRRVEQNQRIYSETMDDIEKTRQRLNPPQ